MQKTILALMLAGIALTTSACQSQPITMTSTATIVQRGIQAPIRTVSDIAPMLVAFPTKLSSATVTCSEIDDHMQKINGESSIEDIYLIQELLKNCLPSVNNATHLQWLADYQAMYSRFLTDGIDLKNREFNEVMRSLDKGKKSSLEQLKALSPRTQYLIDLVAKNADVRIRGLGDGNYTFYHDLKAMSDIFTPYLPKDQKEFIQRMAMDNQATFWDDTSVDIPMSTFIERIAFWEDYIQRYPDGYFNQDAKAVFAMYRYALFFGGDNIQWTDDAIRKFSQPEDKQAMRQLAARPNSVLAQDAQNYLKFMALSDSERQQKYPMPDVKVGLEDYYLYYWLMVRQQLDKALQIPWILQGNSYKECMIDGDCAGTTKSCFDGVFCVDEVTS